MIDKKILSKEEIKRTLDELLDGCKTIQFEGTITYIIDDVKFIQLKKLYACSEFLMQIEEDTQQEKNEEKKEKQEPKKKKKKGPFYKFGKILNFSEFPIIAYKTFLKHKYVNITDPEKVKEQIKREYAIVVAELENHYKDILEKNNVEFEEVERLEDALPKLDILYMTRVQKERFFNEEDYVRMKDFYILDKQKMELAPKDMYILHPLPRVNEIAVEVDDDPRAAYFKQAQYGVYVRMALILRLLEVEV
jgi:hypothetical protein